MPILFDSCFGVAPSLESRHIWVANPGPDRMGQQWWPESDAYATAVVSTHVGDKRITLWDVMNEPTATHLASAPEGKALIDQFVARYCALVKGLDPTHAITVGIATWDNRDVMDVVDVLSCHSYAAGVEAFRAELAGTRDQARAAGKPWIVSECCNPAAGSTYEMVMPTMRDVTLEQARAFALDTHAPTGRARNFGMGGYGVYQAYRRMIREERTDHGAEYLIFYIWGDDHIRSLLRCRHAIIFRWWNHQGGRAFHNNFWPNLEMDLRTGHFVEKENLLPTREALYQMTDPQRMVELLQDDLALQLCAFKAGLIRDVDRTSTSELATRLEYPMDWNQESTLSTQVSGLLDHYSLRATQFVLAKAREFARQNGKKLLVVLFDPYRVVAEMRKSGTRFDQQTVDYLARDKFNYFDMNEVHLRDFQKYNLPYEEYMKQYFIGHYNPRGNHFFAYSIKDRVVEWLDPKPITYRDPDPQSVDFQGYLPDSQ